LAAFDGAALWRAWRDIPWQAWALFAGNLFWVLAFDTEYAMVDRDDDLKIGMKTSAITLGRWDVAAVTTFYVLFMLIWALALAHIDGFAIYLLASAAGVAQVVWHVGLIRHRSREDCFKAFRANHWLGATLFAGLALAQALA
jgi:4-hydroxybenzoate polyprenyltransferase